MKYINKKTVLLIAGAFAAAGMWAQNIELPEVTTVISGDTEKAGADTLPDFSDVLKLPKGSGGVEPVLPEVQASDDAEIAEGKAKPVEKSVYAEGFIGGGYPVFFTGNISVARTVGANPFKFSFEHDSTLGYANHTVTEGYSDRNTKLSVEKKYKKNKLEMGASGYYKSAADGLQGNVIEGSSEIGLFNRDFYNAAGNISYTFNNGFSLGAAATANLYNRYPEITSNWIEKASFFNIEPELLFRWAGYGFDTGFTFDYDYGAEINKSHRVKFMVDLQWENDYIRAYGNAAAVTGSNVMEKSVIVPFTVGIESSFPVSFANRRFAISAEGGIDSYKPKVGQSEERYKFTTVKTNLTEVSEWYGRFNMNVPIKNSFTATAGFEYRQTAYDNGRWNPVYDNSLPIYEYSQSDFRGLSTDFGASYHQGIFTISGSWHSNWIDVPADENTHTVKLDVNFQDENSKWGVDVNFELPINESVETPVLSAEGFVRVTHAVRAVLSLNDCIKLVKGETRHYAGKYEGKGGSAALLLKFVF